MTSWPDIFSSFRIFHPSRKKIFHYFLSKQIPEHGHSSANSLLRKNPLNSHSLMFEQWTIAWILFSLFFWANDLDFINNFLYPPSTITFHPKEVSFQDFGSEEKQEGWQDTLMQIPFCHILLVRHGQDKARSPEDFWHSYPNNWVFEKLGLSGCFPCRAALPGVHSSKQSWVA